MKIVKILLYTTIVLEGGIAILCWFFPSYLKFISALQPLHGENTPKMLLKCEFDNLMLDHLPVL